MFLTLWFLTDQLEHRNAGGCTDDGFTLPDRAVKTVGSLLTTMCIGRELVDLLTQADVATESKNSPRKSEQLPQIWGERKESNLYYFTANMK